MLLICKVMSKIREDQGITRFMNTFRSDGRSYDDIYQCYVTGLDVSGNYVGLAAHKARGAAIGVMEHVWLGLWD